MSVTKIEPMWQQRGSELGGIDATTARRQWRIRTDDKNDSWQMIAAWGIAAGHFPNQYDGHPENIYLTARRLRVENQPDSAFHWIATADYSSAPLRDRDIDRQLHPDPCDRKAKRIWNTTIYQKAVDRDRFGNAILNSAGDRPDKPPEKDASHWICRVTKNLRTLPTWILDYNDCPINDDDFEIGGIEVSEGCARLYELNIGEEQIENGFSYHVLSYTLEFRKEGWIEPLLDQGLRILNDDGELEHITIADAHGETSKVSSPCLLDGEGGLLEDPTPDNAVFIDYELYEPKDFEVLPRE